MSASMEIARRTPLEVDPKVSAGASWRAPTGRADKIRLDLNENRFLSSARLSSLMASIAPDQLTMYPEYDAVYRALSRYSGRPREELLLSNGADQGIELVLRAFCPRRKLVLPVPTFSYYQHVAALLGIELLKVPYGADFELSATAVLDALHAGADGVALVTPSNPLGTALSREFVWSVAAEAERLGAFVLIDEVYYEFDGDSFAELLDAFDNVVLVRSFSKGFGLAGARIGYLASAPPNLEQLDKVRGPWDVNAVGARLVTGALARGDWLDFVPAVREERERLRSCLLSSGYQVRESRTNFVVARHPLASAIAGWLAREGVLVSDLRGYPDSNGVLEHCLRIGVPNPNERDAVHALLLRAVAACKEGI